LVDNLERAEQEAKVDLTCVSKQALLVKFFSFSFNSTHSLRNDMMKYIFFFQNKENYEETLSKYNSQLQQNQAKKNIFYPFCSMLFFFLI
jgi:hypothetical protein